MREHDCVDQPHLSLAAHEQQQRRRRHCRSGSSPKRLLRAPARYRRTTISRRPGSSHEPARAGTVRLRPAWIPAPHRPRRRRHVGASCRSCLPSARRAVDALLAVAIMSSSASVKIRTREGCTLLSSTTAASSVRWCSTNQRMTTSSNRSKASTKMPTNPSSESADSRLNSSDAGR